MHEAFREILGRYARVAIAGGPKCGKSTMASNVTDRDVLSPEPFEALPWSEVPLAMVAATTGRKRFVIEGVHVARALRKGMEVDAVIYLHKPRVPRTSRQIGMAKGVHTVMMDWRENDKGTPVYVME